MKAKSHIIINNAELEKAVIVCVQSQNIDNLIIDRNINELIFLAQTAGADCQKVFIQKLEKPHPKLYVGTGKIEEVKLYITENEISTIFFDDELTPGQQRNLEKELENVKIIDRSSLILDIFAKHARTAQAKAQVELAQYQYLLPRLTNLWSHLSRQKGGIGMKGPGEKEIETDRRIIREKITLLKEELKLIDKQSIIRRKSRKDKVKAVLVGYTNVGKSSIINLISDAEVLSENKLFATLDTTVRKVFYDGVPFLLADTVGFINKLPHHLVESFKSTLDEVKEADIIIHVVDISHPYYEDQMKTVNETLASIGAENKPTIVVFNKLDIYQDAQLLAEESSDINHKRKYIENLSTVKNNVNTVVISTLLKYNIQSLTTLISTKVKEELSLRYGGFIPQDDFQEM
jgi:GTP-binding protein HflX